MLASKAVRAATIAVAGAFLLSALPALAGPVVPAAKPAAIEQSSAFALAATAATDKNKKKPVKKVASKKKPAKKVAAKKPAKKTTT